MTLNEFESYWAVNTSGRNNVQGSSNFNFGFAGEIPIYDYSNESQLCRVVLWWCFYATQSKVNKAFEFVNS